MLTNSTKQELVYLLALFAHKNKLKNQSDQPDVVAEMNSILAERHLPSYLINTPRSISELSADARYFGHVSWDENDGWTLSERGIARMHEIIQMHKNDAVSTVSHELLNGTLAGSRFGGLQLAR